MPDFHDRPAEADTELSYDEMLDDCNDCGKLSDWEMNFIDDMLHRRDGLRDMTWNQAAKLLQIWEKHCD
jgi:hypothetical protein